MTTPPGEETEIRVMHPHEIALAVEWAAREGWNPGLADAECFAVVDPQGFLIELVNGEPAATVSAINYDDHFSFYGLYIVRPDLRGRGLGWRLTQAAMAHAGNRVKGCDGVVAQQATYRKIGFELAYRNIRYGGELAAAAPPADATVLNALTDIPLSIVAVDDATVFPAARLEFLRAWIGASGHTGCALVRDGDLSAWGVIRRCRVGHKIGPLVADDRAGAEAVFDGLLAAAGGGPIFLDVPEVNKAAVALAETRGLKPVFETARMYSGPIRPLRLDRVFGVTTFELG
jgi:ribosomal protein S18 acetylase RimI-like enzyme